MYKNKTICVVIPAFNEASQIGGVIDTVPDYVDWIVIVDDSSTDDTASVVAQFQKHHSRVVLLRHDVNQGCGGALATGYIWARDNTMDIAVRMDGDGQMSPKDLPALLDPIARGMADYAKGNRLVSGEAYQKIPRIRYFGNAFLSLLTKIASGYWHVADFQSGYTAMNEKVLHTIDWQKMYKRYGQPNDLMVRLNIYNFKIADVPVEAVYHVGEKSGIRIKKVIFTISWLLAQNVFLANEGKIHHSGFSSSCFFLYAGGDVWVGHGNIVYPNGLL